MRARKAWANVTPSDPYEVRRRALTGAVLDALAQTAEDIESWESIVDAAERLKLTEKCVATVCEEIVERLYAQAQRNPSIA